MSKEEIKRLLMNGNTKEYSHMIIFCDTFDYEDYAVYVKYDQDVENVIKEERKLGNMIKVMEVYNYNLDLEMQLNEYRANHIEPKIKKDDNKIHSDKIKKALEFAKGAHLNQIRADGSPYINHPINVAENVKKYIKSNELDNLIICALLHDTIEDTDTTYYDIADNFGYFVASIVLELTNDKDMKNLLGKTRYLQIKMKNMTNFALDIKLCDRLNNVMDLDVAPEDFREKYTIETIDIMSYLTSNRKLTQTQKELISLINNEIKKQRENTKKYEKKGEDFIKMLKKLTK